LRSTEARTRDELQTAIAAALACVTAKDAMNWFVSYGYSFNLIRSKEAPNSVCRPRYPMSPAGATGQT
jgi:hypothetical protein